MPSSFRRTTHRHKKRGEIVLSDYVYVFNVFETVLWTVQAMIVFATAVRTRDRRWRLCFAAIVFLLFAGSEVMELQTGAWWRPLWLAVWKGACIITLVALGIDHYRWRKSQTPDDETSSD